MGIKLNRQMRRVVVSNRPGPVLPVVASQGAPYFRVTRLDKIEPNKFPNDTRTRPDKTAPKMLSANKLSADGSMPDYPRSSHAAAKTANMQFSGWEAKLRSDVSQPSRLGCRVFRLSTCATELGDGIFYFQQTLIDELLAPGVRSDLAGIARRRLIHLLPTRLGRSTPRTDGYNFLFQEPLVFLLSPRGHDTAVDVRGGADGSWTDRSCTAFTDLFALVPREKSDICTPDHLLMHPTLGSGTRLYSTIQRRQSTGRGPCPRGNTFATPPPQRPGIRW
jgi:hypothetical protein